MTSKLLYITDLDGTLLDNDGRLSDVSRETLTRLLDDGLPFTIASARSVVSMQGILGDLPLRLPVVEFNGSFISDLATGRHETCNAIGNDIVESIVERAVGQGVRPYVSTFDGERDRLHYLDPINDGERWYVADRRRVNDPRLHRVEALGSYSDEQVVCLPMIDRRETLKPLKDWIDSTYDSHIQVVLQENTYSPGWFWLMVHDVRATKANAIRMLLEAHGFDVDQLTVFGDGVNDIPMFEIAGRRVAVDNADDEVKRHADLVIGRNHEDAVVRFIEQDWNGADSCCSP